MAASLSRWTKDALLKSTAHDYEGEDQSFVRGGKVQILSFIVYDQFRNEDETGLNDQGDTWAIVADREHSVLVRFTAQCVRCFDSTHTRPLLSLRGSIIQLRRYRPQVSARAALVFLQGSDASKSGPFAQNSAASYRVCFEVETFYLWGSINAPTFFDSIDLQSVLIKDAVNGSDTDNRSFVKWFGVAVSKAYRARALQRVEKRERLANEKREAGRSKADTSPLAPTKLAHGNIVTSQVEPLGKDDGNDEFGLEQAADLALDGRLTYPSDEDGKTTSVMVNADRDDGEIDHDELNEWRSADIVVNPTPRPSKRQKRDSSVTGVSQPHVAKSEPLVTEASIPPESVDENWLDLLV